MAEATYDNCPHCIERRRVLLEFLEGLVKKRLLSGRGFCLDRESSKEAYSDSEDEEDFITNLRIDLPSFRDQKRVADTDVEFRFSFFLGELFRNRILRLRSFGARTYPYDFPSHSKVSLLVFHHEVLNYLAGLGLMKTRVISITILLMRISIAFLGTSFKLRGSVFKS